MHLFSFTLHILLTTLVSSGHSLTQLPLYNNLLFASLVQSSIQEFVSLITYFASSGHCNVSKVLYCP